MKPRSRCRSPTERLWFLDKLEPGNATYNVPLALRIHGPLDVEALRRALDELARRHEVLRTTYRAFNGRPAQVVADQATLALTFLDLSGHPDREAEAERRVSEEVRTGFDLENGPILRASLLRLDEQDHVLLLTIHHIAIDGWSLGVLGHELGALYQAFTGGTPTSLAKLPVQYADYAVWQRAWLQGDVLEQQVAYWRQRLEGARRCSTCRQTGPGRPSRPTAAPAARWCSTAS